MATVFAIWDRQDHKLLGDVNGRAELFNSSALATAAVTGRRFKYVPGNHTFDVLTLTV